MICAVLLASDIEMLEEQIQIAISSGVDMLEIRIDGFHEFDTKELAQVVKRISLPYTVSLRSEWYNREIGAPLPGRKKVLREIIELDPPMIDLQFPIDMPLLQDLSEQTIPIISMLDYEGMVKIAFRSLTQVAKQHQEVIVKISANPSTVLDLKQLWKWASQLQKEGINHTVIGIDHLGKISRYKSRELGNYFTYGRIGKDTGEPMMPGMVSVKQLKSAFADDSWHLGSIQGSKQINNEAILEKFLEQGGMKGIFVDVSLKTKPEADQFILWVKDGLLDGLLIHQPWQKMVVEWLDIKDSSVWITGECDLIINQERGLKGYNTNIQAMERLLGPSLGKLHAVYIEGSNFLVRAILSLFKENTQRYQFQVIIREPDDMIFEDLQKEYPFIKSSFDSFIEDFDLIINCRVPDPGYENVLPMSSKLVKHAKIIIDPLASPSHPTQLIRYSRKNNIQYFDGWDLYLSSIQVAMELWTGIKVHYLQIPKLYKLEKKLKVSDVFDTQQY